MAELSTTTVAGRPGRSPNDPGRRVCLSGAAVRALEAVRVLSVGESAGGKLTGMRDNHCPEGIFLVRAQECGWSDALVPRWVSGGCDSGVLRGLIALGRDRISAATARRLREP
jgi:hypothetical protein